MVTEDEEDTIGRLEEEGERRVGTPRAATSRASALPQPFSSVFPSGRETHQNPGGTFPRINTECIRWL